MLPTSLLRLVEDYLADCRARGLSPKTIKDAYAYPLRDVLLPWCERIGIIEVTGLDARALNRLTSELLERGGRRGPLSRYTIDTYVRNINLFLGWCRREGLLDGTVRAQAPKLPRRVLDVLSAHELDRLEDVARSERDKLIVRLLADTGMRAGELLQLREADLVDQGRDRFLRLRGKGAKERLVPVQPQLYRRLQRLDRARPSDARGDTIFISLTRRPGGAFQPLTISGLDQLIRGLGERAGLQKRVYPHLLRHSFATRMLNRGMDPITLSRILGHSSLVMIQRTYAHQSAGDLSEALMRALAAD
ncbi:MAG: tyrosine-type recombinase/integrase [Candidatus Dormibacteraeota bacterium]|nr:tyrosine-type recombinase/integrase [Candidatus Dormibacteraeota bacterium]MDQ6900208.1 tyrosine-type recombinase/integrase [Candidatus Dormibacteraeota bacterium]